RRMQCGNSLHNLALAMHNYADVHKRFPFASVCTTQNTCHGVTTSTFGSFRDTAACVWGTTWTISLMPFIEQSTLFDKWDSTRGYGVNANQALVTSTALPIMKCPSDVKANAANITGVVAASFDKGNYGLNMGGGSANENGNSGNRAGPEDVPTWTVATYGRASKNRGLSSGRDGAIGPVNLPTSVGIEDILDGTSNTFMLGEMIKNNNVNDCRGCWGKAFGAVVSAYTLGNPEVNGLNGVATPNVPAVGIYVDRPTHCSNVAGDPQLACSSAAGDGLGGNALRSRHPGGVQVAFCDGRVTFISNTVNKATYRALFTIAGGEAATDY
ncbi:MAG: DUF1559 domain-containing protein, partial [Pirellulaceae bacterium]